MTLPGIGDLRPWADPEVVSINRLPMRTPYESSARRRVSLNGDWSVQRWSHPDLVRAESVGDIDDSSWKRIPWDGLPPSLPNEVPTVVSRKSFRAPKRTGGDGVILHVGGAESVHAVWVNGEFIGYGTDSRLASEYDITGSLCDADNTVAIVVCRYSAQSHVEDQD